MSPLSGHLGLLSPKAVARGALRSALVGLRRRYYADGAGQQLVERCPDGWRRRLGLDDQAAVGSRRLELGSGDRPRAGYVHVDLASTATHVEFRADVLDLPLASGWAEEILAIHVLEHVPPGRQMAALAEWRRVLRPGGRLRVHVPDSAGIMARWLGADWPERWALSGALLGMYAHKEVRAPDELRERADHQVLFDQSLLRQLLEQAGFVEVVDLTEEVEDVHTAGWRPLVPRISLVFEGRRP